MTGWTKMALGMEIGLGPGHIALDGVPPLRETGTKGVRRRGLTGPKPLPKYPEKIIYSFKSGAFYVSQFVQRSQFHNHFITIVYIN